MAAWRLIADRTIAILGDPRHPSALSPQAAFVLKVNDAVVDGGSGYAFNASMFVRNGRWYWDPPAASAGPKQVAPRVQQLVSMVMIWCDSFQHFVFDCLPRLELVADVLASDASIHVLVQPGVGFSELALLVLGPAFTADRFIVANGALVYPADVVWVPHFAQQTKMGFVPPGIAFQRSAALLRVQPASPRNLVVYLARAHGRPRSVLNEKELLEAVQTLIAPHGLLLEVLLDPHDWRADRELLSRAALLFGPHGGSFANMLFLQPGTPVLEFLSTLIAAEARDCYAGLAAGLGLPFWRYAPPVFSYERPMRIDVDDVLSMLKQTGILHYSWVAECCAPLGMFGGSLSLVRPPKVMSSLRALLSRSCPQYHVFLGMCGGIASGKSNACRVLEKLGAVCVDTDKIAHKGRHPPCPTPLVAALRL